jgi:hypothetical protein
VSDSECGVDGHCISQVCECIAGLWGRNCSLECPSRCSSNGMCAKGVCFCDEAFVGSDCSQHFGSSRVEMIPAPSVIGKVCLFPDSGSSSLGIV